MIDQATGTAPNDNTLTPGSWTIDPTTSTVGFVTKNFLGMKVTGVFRDVDAAIDVGQSASDSSIRVAIGVRSVDTRSRLRDKDLHKKKIFHSDQWPELRFESTKIELADNGELAITGFLTVRDQTNTIDLVAVADGSDALRYRATGRLNPRDFGITHAFVRHDVDLTIDVALIPN